MTYTYISQKIKIQNQDIDFLDIENYTQLNTNKESTKELIIKKYIKKDLRSFIKHILST